MAHVTLSLESNHISGPPPATSVCSHFLKKTELSPTVVPAVSSISSGLHACPVCSSRTVLLCSGVKASSALLTDSVTPLQCAPLALCTGLGYCPDCRHCTGLSPCVSLLDKDKPEAMSGLSEELSQQMFIERKEGKREGTL